MSIAKLWQLQQLEVTREKESKQLDKQLLKALAREKELLLARQERLKEEKAEWEKIKKQYKRISQELDQLEAKKKELNQELYSGKVASPKELSHLEEQVQGLDGKINGMVDEYLKLEEKSIAMENIIQVKHQELAQDMTNYNQKAKAVKGDWQAVKARIETLTEKIKQTVVQVDPSLLAQYRRLQQRLGTSVLAPVEQGFCGGCGIQIPSMFNQQLKQGESIKCENCGRLLVVS